MLRFVAAGKVQLINVRWLFTGHERWVGDLGRERRHHGRSAADESPDAARRAAAPRAHQRTGRPSRTAADAAADATAAAEAGHEQ